MTRIQAIVDGIATEPAVAVRRSRVNGRGLFARRPLPARRKIGELSGTLVPLRSALARAAGTRRICLVQVSARLALDCSGGNEFRFLNHSCQPNCYLRVYRGRVEVYARGAIAAGAELSVDYGETPHRGGMRCTCGTPRCRGRL